VDRTDGPVFAVANKLVEVEHVLARHGYQRSELIGILQDIQGL
jgi:hypothetical protein